MTTAAVAQNNKTSASHSATTIRHDGTGNPASGLICFVSVSSVIKSEAKCTLPKGNSDSRYGDPAEDRGDEKQLHQISWFWILERAKERDARQRDQYCH